MENKEEAMGKAPKGKKGSFSTASGIKYLNHDNTLRAGDRGPLLLQDFILHEKLGHFHRERIPERVVHAKGAGAYGVFTVTNDITQYTRAKVFSKIGKKTKVFLRFSTVAGERGSADSERDPRGFAVKFYTEDGNWDIVGNNTPVFFINDPKKFPDFIHTVKRDPRTNLKDATMQWDYFGLNPESMHQVMILMSDRGTPANFRHMNGYGTHTFSLVNDKNEVSYVKFHFKTAQGIKNLTNQESLELRKTDPDHAQHDLVDAIDSGDFPKWNLRIQIMTEDQANHQKLNPFDPTKVWPHKDFPLIDVGVLELNEIPKNYFASVEQAAFAPAHVVDGIGYSADRLLQGRILSYPDAHRYRLGVNYEQIPVNKCPYASRNYQRDGQMRVDDNGADHPNYYPNSHDFFEQDEAYKHPPINLPSQTADWYNEPDDYYVQPRALWQKVFSDTDRKNLVHNVVSSMRDIKGPNKMLIINRQMGHFFKIDPALSEAISQELGVEVSVNQI